MPLCLGFDLGGTQLRAALVEDGRIIRRAATPTDVKGGPEAILLQIQALADEMRSRQSKAKLTGAGIASPGPIDTATGIVDHIPSMPGWDNVPLRQRMSELLDLPVVVENDGLAAAYGEWKQGAGRGLRHLVYVTVSTGIGGGVVVDGRLLHGRRGMAAHIGHSHLNMSGPKCGCGGIGCFEAYASGTALGERARAAALSNPSGYLTSIAAKEQVTSRHVVEGARAGDSQCLTLLKEEARYLGIGFVSILHLFSPEKIIMGGGVSTAFDLLQSDIRAVIDTEAMPPYRAVEIVPAELGDNAGLIGAALLSQAQCMPEHQG
jgi:glucokinase